MNYLILITSFLVAINSFSQVSGTILYTETIKLEFELPEGIDVSGMMSNDMSNDKILSFQNSESVYRDDKGNQNREKEISSDDGSFKMVFKMDSKEVSAANRISEPGSSRRLALRATCSADSSPET